MSCQFIDCNIRAYYNFPKTQPGIRCATHRLNGMVNVYDKTCREEGCLKRPLYNFPNEKRGVTCKEHSENGMVDLQNKKCHCGKAAGYNYPGEKGRFCLTHSEEGMVLVNQNKCKHQGCNVTARYNFPSAKRTGKYCSNHKLPGMIHVSTGLCAIETCTISATYGDKNNKEPTHCHVHRQNEMMDVVHKLCEHSQCLTRPMYNEYGNHTGRFCVIHKQEEMVHIQVYPCTSCGLGFRFRDNTVAKVCVYCDSNSTLRSITKENHVKEILEQSFPDIPFIHDRSISSIKTIDQKCVYVQISFTTCLLMS